MSGTSRRTPLTRQHTDKHQIEASRKHRCQAVEAILSAKHRWHTDTCVLASQGKTSSTTKPCKLRGAHRLGVLCMCWAPTGGLNLLAMQATRNCRYSPYKIAISEEQPGPPVACDAADGGHKAAPAAVTPLWSSIMVHRAHLLVYSPSRQLAQWSITLSASDCLASLQAAWVALTAAA